MFHTNKIPYLSYSKCLKMSLPLHLRILHYFLPFYLIYNNSIMISMCRTLGVCIFLIFLQHLCLNAQILDDSFCPLQCTVQNGSCGNHSDRGSLNTYLYRTIDGSNNDFYNNQEGQAHSNFIRKYNDACYDGDGNAMVDRGNPRMISNLICTQEISQENELGLSDLVFTFLQFIDHDITATEEGTDDKAPIAIPQGDVYFDPFGTGTQYMNFTRVAVAEGTGSSNENPRQQINTITAWMDASMVYGSDSERANWLRSFDTGKLKVSNSPQGDLLPYNTISGEFDDDIDVEAPFMSGETNSDGSYNKVFVTGDVRGNEQLGLTALHLLFVKEHNRICDERIANGYRSDEANYQYARKIVGGIIQAIFYNELAPLLGIKTGSNRYRFYKSPNIFNEFATAAFRLGHTMLNENLHAIDQDCNETVLPLAQAFFRPDLLQQHEIGEVLGGLSTKAQQEVDVQITDAVRNFLFGPPGAGGFDLASLNIQRGRDHGLPDYNTLRGYFGVGEVQRFNQITSNRDLRIALRTAYGSVNNIDPWIGMLAEDKANDEVFGPLFKAILSEQFTNIKEADRFYFLRDPLLKWGTKKEISNTRLADVINRNTSATNLSNVFIADPCSIEMSYCDAEGKSTNYEWINFIKINNDLSYTGNDGGYGDYTDKTFTFYKGQNNTLKLRPGYANNYYKEFWNIWIDLNENGIFETSELIYRNKRYGTIYDNCWIDNTLNAGTYNMRISMKYGSYPSNACESFAYGEVEDYTVEIVNSPFFRINNDQLAITLQMNLFPNPAVDFVNLDIESSIAYQSTIQVYDQLGRTIYEEKIDLHQGMNNHEINSSNYPKGMYVLSLKKSDGTLINKSFIVNRP